MLKLWLVRHGQTDWNIEGRIQGQVDIPLNATGRAQAEALACKLADKPFIAVYSSDLERARETAEILAAPHELPVQIDPRLREINQGEWEGLTLNAVREQHAAQFNPNAPISPDFRPPLGESVTEVAERMQAVFNDIQKKHPSGAVLIVTHGLSAATVACWANSVGLDLARKMIPQNAEPLCVVWPLTESW